MSWPDQPKIDRINQTGWLKQERFIFTILKAGKSKIKQILCLMEACSLVSRQPAAFSLYSHMADRERGQLSNVSSHKGTIPFMRAPPL